MSDLIQDYDRLSAVGETAVQNSWYMKTNTTMILGAARQQCSENGTLVVSHGDVAVIKKHLDHNVPATFFFGGTIHCGEPPLPQPVFQRIVFELDRNKTNIYQWYTEKPSQNLVQHHSMYGMYDDTVLKNKKENILDRRRPQSPMYVGMHISI